MKRYLPSFNIDGDELEDMVQCEIGSENFWGGTAAEERERDVLQMLVTQQLL